MANSQKKPKMKGNFPDNQLPSLDEIKTILFKILPKGTASEIIR